MTDTTQEVPRRGASGARVPPATRTKSPPIPPQPEDIPVRKKAVLELIGAACIPLAGMAAVEQARLPEGRISPFAMDIFTIQSQAEPIADAVVSFAGNYPVLGAILDKVSKATGLGGLVATVMTLGLQLAENHGKLSLDAKLIPGVVPREEMAAVVLAQSAEHANGNTAA